MSKDIQRFTPERVVLGSLRSNEIVYDRSDYSHNHITEADLLEDALFRVDSGERRFFREIVEFEESVGLTHCVETTATDQIIFAQRIGRAGLTRFVIDREPSPTNKISVVLIREAEMRIGSYILISAMLGDACREPWDEGLKTPEEVEESKRFWETHALVWDPNRDAIDFSVRIIEEPRTS